MKAGIHPAYYSATVTCSSCGSTYTIGSTQETIHVELCSHCHPFYTGEERFVDTASKIDKFTKAQKIAKELQKKMAAKKEEKKRQDSAPKTLAEMLAAAK